MRLRTEKGAAADLRHGRRARRHRVGKRQQRAGGRRPRSDRRVRRARLRRHGDPARRVHDPRPRAGTGHAQQEPPRHLLDGVVDRARQHPGRGPVLPVLRTVRQACDAALHADHAVGARHHLHRRLPGLAQLGRPLDAAHLRPARLDDEAAEVAASAAGPRPRAGRHHRALPVHLDPALWHRLVRPSDRHRHLRDLGARACCVRCSQDVKARRRRPRACSAGYGKPRVQGHAADACLHACACSAISCGKRPRGTSRRRSSR